MVDRFLVWLGAAMVTAGVMAATVAGGGAASAESPPGADAAGTTSSEAAKKTESKADSDADGAGRPDTKPSGTKPKKDETADPAADAKTPHDAEQPAQQQAEEPEIATVKDAKPAGSDTLEKLADQPAKPAAHEQKPAAKPAADHEDEASTSEESVESTETPVEPAAAAVVPLSRIAEAPATLKTAAPQTAAVAFAAPVSATITSTAAAPGWSGLLSAIGTIVFNLYGLAISVVGGPPILPAGSTVTVRSSTLQIDCGDGYTVPADWYIPNTAAPPTGLIYLQHGFLAAGPWYSHTAAALAEQTNSIVVAPSITSNFLSCDACWLGAPPMQQAVANLFEDENTALAESALAAGYTGPIPDQVVLVGHSLGGALVAGTGRYMVDNETVDRLAGVVMLDGVGLDGSMASSLDEVPDGIPIYQLGAPRYFWNLSGVGSDALLEARDGFVGVTLVGGSHVDAMRGGNPLIQFSQQLVSGLSRTENVAAAQILMVGWINDMFVGNRRAGIYLDPSEEFVFDTPAGGATVVALPNTLTKPFVLNPLQPLVALAIGFFTFEPTCPVASTCAAKSSIAA
jgi:hypothetical protein